MLRELGTHLEVRDSSYLSGKWSWSLPAGCNQKTAVDCPLERGTTMRFFSALSQEMLYKPSLLSISRKHMTEAAPGVGCRQV